MSKQEDIFHEVFIKYAIEDTVKCFNRRDRTQEELQNEAENQWQEMLRDKDSIPMMKMVYSAMDKYHNSFIMKK